jgi:DNA-binding LacI/PurR family transcriptional regulator
VSASTVSRCLSGTKTSIRISPETRKRVLDAVRDLGYQPNPAARALRGKSTKVLGLIVPDINDCFIAELIHAIGDEAGRQGYEILLGYARRDRDEALLLSQVLDLRRCDGLLLTGAFGDSDEEDNSLQAQLWKNQKVVSVCRGTGNLARKTASIGTDNRAGVFVALDYLVGLGHKKIAFIGGSAIGDLKERLEAFREFMADRSLKVKDEYVLSTPNSYRGGYQAMKRLLSLAEPPTAVFAVNDTRAIGALRAAVHAQVDVPAQVSLIGFDDIQISAYLTPALTTVSQLVNKIGQRAVQLLLGLIKTDTNLEKPPRVLVDPQLVVRDSCAPPRSGTLADPLDDWSTKGGGQRISVV